MSIIDTYSMETQIKNITTIHKGKYRDLVAAEFVTPKNTVETTEYLHDCFQTVFILPFTPHGTIVTIDEYRVPIDSRILSLPAGTFDPNSEKAIDCAHRELQEETGYTAPEMYPLGTFFGAPAISNRKMDLFVAFNAVKSGDTQFDDSEDIIVCEHTYDQLKDMFVSQSQQMHVNIFAAYEMARIKFPEKFSR